MEPATSIRPAAVAGMFYPAGASDLAAEVEHWITAGQAAAPGDAVAPKALVVPHAGYRYSGAVAGRAYALLRRTSRGRVRRVVLLGPAHRVALRGLALPSASSFGTPLGEVRVDAAGCATARRLPQVVVRDDVHALEHSLEVQLPFLQAALGEFSIVPLVVGRASSAEVAGVIDALWGGDETLVVVSSDLSHYLGYDEARSTDARTVAAIASLEPRVRHDEACGATPVNGLLECARARGLRARVLDVRNSGDTEGSRDRVVGYCSIAFEPLPDAALGSALLAHARGAIADALGGSPAQAPDHPALASPGATFVTLTLAGALRGCIGSLEARRALRLDVRENAVAAAFRDPRFAPLSATELDRVRVEVSLLGASQPLAVRDEAHARSVLRPGRDGVVLEWRGRRATFLPQVWDSLRDPAEFLGQLKRKAGLAEGFWADDLTLSRYEVVKWAETAARRS